jgi:hypothetical protein
MSNAYKQSVNTLESTAALLASRAHACVTAGADPQQIAKKILGMQAQGPHAMSIVSMMGRDARMRLYDGLVQRDLAKINDALNEGALLLILAHDNLYKTFKARREKNEAATVALQEVLTSL